MNANEQNFYRRMNEIGEYQYNSHLDTVFIFQIFFIFLLVVIGLLYLKSINIITSFFTYPVIIFLTIIVILIFVNRVVFTNRIRSSRNWSELNFNTPTPVNYVKGGTNEGSKGLVNVAVPPQSSQCPAGQQMRSQCTQI